MIVLRMSVSFPSASSEAGLVAADEDRCIKDSVYPVEAERGEVNGGDEPRRDVPDGPRDRRVPKGSRHPMVGQELEGRPEALAAATTGSDGGSSACESPDGVVAQDRRDGDRSGIRGRGVAVGEAARLSKGAARRGSSSDTAEV
jgi:hypothetical protein